VANERQGFRVVWETLNPQPLNSALAMDCYAWSPAEDIAPTRVLPPFPTNLRVVGVVSTRIVGDAGSRVGLAAIHAVGCNRKEDVMVTGILRRPANFLDKDFVDVQAASVDVDTNPAVATM
jgi:hypothetical protein